MYLLFRIWTCFLNPLLQIKHNILFTFPKTIYFPLNPSNHDCSVDFDYLIIYIFQINAIPNTLKPSEVQCRRKDRQKKLYSRPLTSHANFTKPTCFHPILFLVININNMYTIVVEKWKNSLIFGGRFKIWNVCLKNWKWENCEIGYSLWRKWDVMLCV